MSEPVLVDVITPLPEGWGICTNCEMLIAQAEMEMDTAEARCRAALAELERKKQRRQAATKDGEVVGEG